MQSALKWPSLLPLILAVAMPALVHAAQPALPPPLPEVVHPPENPFTEAKWRLGRRLFFDPLLSREENIACGSCHDRAHAFAQPQRFSIGTHGRSVTRNSPGLINVAYQERFFWDGRTATLEEQALAPIAHPDEMDLPLPELVARLNAQPTYVAGFTNVFGGPATAERVAQALACFERTLVSRETPFDRFLAGQRQALSPPVHRGLELFYGQARCHVCHSGSNLSDQKFHNVGLGDDRATADTGRAALTGKDADRGLFKTPALREVAHTAPYMHHGGLATLEDVVTHYNFGGVAEQAVGERDRELEVLYLSEAQVRDLVAFLREGLSSPQPPPADRLPGR